MPNYIIAYHGAGKFETPEQGAAARAKWKVWVGGLGDAVVNPGTPLVRGKLVSSAGVSKRQDDLLTGFSVVRADNMDAAQDRSRLFAP
ncbi:MAG: hypothetical protein E6G85_30410 [Alphaproteobacteria bacterium]|nr:MAG: hypothetical protein E6G85_30410 [Alphaproteobacteria bacterium]